MKTLLFTKRVYLVTLTTAYIHPRANTDQALNHLSDVISSYENNDPSTLSIICGDFNQANLRNKLPNYHQLVTCSTRGCIHCYSTIKGVYKSIQRSSLGNSDHSTVLLIPTYKQVLKQSKPVKKTVKLWTNEATEKLRGCLESTDWEIFNYESNLDEFTDTVTDYIKFCEDVCLPTKTVTYYPNNKGWFNSSLKTALKLKDNAYKNRHRDPITYRNAKTQWNRAVSKAKEDYKTKLEAQFNTNDSQQVWSSMKLITNYKGPKKSVECTDPSLPDQLNDFYARFDRENSSQPAFSVCGVASPPFEISENDVRRRFSRLKERKAPGPDGLSPRLLKTCASQLAGVFARIFNESLHKRKVPALFKQATIVPVPKKKAITCLNDYRPVALTAVPMKIFERIVLKFIKSIVPAGFDPHQFAYRKNRSVEDAISLCLHKALQHLEHSSSYARILFIDFSSAFNTIIPAKLHYKLLTNLKFPPALCDWILDFLINRSQIVRINNSFSSSITLSTGAPQGCVLSPVLYSLFTSDFTTTDANTHIVKFADDTTICGFILNNDESHYRAQIESTVKWCAENNLELNVSKTKELVIDFRKLKNNKEALAINGQPIMQVDNFKFLGTVIENDLKWNVNINEIVKKARQRLYFLRSLNSFGVQQMILVSFYRAIIESVLTRSITVWYGAASKEGLDKLNSVIRNAERIIRVQLPSLETLYKERSLKRTTMIIQDKDHPANKLFVTLRSGRRFRTFKGNKRLTNSFYPSATRIYNALN